MCCEYKYKVFYRLSFLLIFLSTVASIILAGFFQSDYEYPATYYPGGNDPYKCTEVDEGNGPRGKHTCDRSD